MAGLPRESTKKQFKKLLKKSGKSKTNTMYGATATNKNISTYDPGAKEHLITKFKSFVNEAFSSKCTIGIDIDGTICNFSDAYNQLYKQYFPNKETVVNDNWYWYRSMDYDGQDPDKWFKEKKAEIFGIAQPYQDAVVTINNVYDFIKTHGHSLKIVTNQPTPESKEAAKKWLDKYGFKYDDLVFVEAAKDKWNNADVMVDDAEKVIGNKPLSKVAIKIQQLWNTNVEGDFNIQSIRNLTINLIQQAIANLKITKTL